MRNSPVSVAIAATVYPLSDAPIPYGDGEVICIADRGASETLGAAAFGLVCMDSLPRFQGVPPVRSFGIVARSLLPQAMRRTK